MKRLMFVTWDSADSNYVPSLFAPLLHSISDRGYQVSVLQFGTGGLDEKRSREACEQLRLKYEFVKVPGLHQGLSVSLMILEGARRLVAAAEKFDVLMPRSVVPAAMCLLARKLGCTLPICYDSDGLMADERVEYGQWSPIGMRYNIARDVEFQIIHHAKAILTRSRKGANILVNRAGPDIDSTKFHVVANSRNSDYFVPLGVEEILRKRIELGLDPNLPVVGYVGSLGEKYDIESMKSIFAILQHFGGFQLLFVTRQLELAHQELESLDATILSAEPHQIPTLLGCMDIGLAMFKGHFSLKAVAPVKVGEYLLAGVPVVLSENAGDLPDHVNPDWAYVIGECLDEEEFLKWVATILRNREYARASARTFGEAQFSFDSTLESYLIALQSCHPR